MFKSVRIAYDDICDRKLVTRSVCCFRFRVWDRFELIILGVFLSQKLELNIIYFICFDNSIKKVIQCTCVDFCEISDPKTCTLNVPRSNQHIL